MGLAKKLASWGDATRMASDVPKAETHESDLSTSGPEHLFQEDEQAQESSLGKAQGSGYANLKAHLEFENSSYTLRFQHLNASILLLKQRDLWRLERERVLDSLKSESLEIYNKVKQMIGIGTEAQRNNDDRDDPLQPRETGPKFNRIARSEYYGYYRQYLKGRIDSAGHALPDVSKSYSSATGDQAHHDEDNSQSCPPAPLPDLLDRARKFRLLHQCDTWCLLTGALPLQHGWLAETLKNLHSHVTLWPHQRLAPLPGRARTPSFKWALVALLLLHTSTVSASPSNPNVSCLVWRDWDFVECVLFCIFVAQFPSGIMLILLNLFRIVTCLKPSLISVTGRYITFSALATCLLWYVLAHCVRLRRLKRAGDYILQTSTLVLVGFLFSIAYHGEISFNTVTTWMLPAASVCALSPSIKWERSHVEILDAEGDGLSNT